MRRAANTLYAELPTKLSEIAKEVADGRLFTITGRKQKCVGMFAPMAIDDLTEFIRHRDMPVLSTFTQDLDDEIVEIAIRFRDRKGFTDAQTRVQEQATHHVSANLVLPLGLEAQYGPNWS